MLQTLFIFVLAPLVIITGLLYAIGVIEWKPKDYSCWPYDEKIMWGQKIQVAQLGSLNLYVYPMAKTCEEEHRTYGGKIENGYPTQYQ